MLRKALPNNSRVKLIVCDMAGTTINEKGIVYKTLLNTFQGRGYPVDETQLKPWYGAQKSQVISHFMNKYESPKFDRSTIRKKMESSFNENLKEHYFNHNNISLVDENIPEIFEEIRKKDIKIALNTGYSKEMQEQIINHLHMKDYIDDYISSEEVHRGRPSHFMIHKLMNNLNIDSSKEVIKIGDTRNDILEGLNARCCLSLGVLSGADNKTTLFHAGAQYVLNNVTNLPLLLTPQNPHT